VEEGPGEAVQEEALEERARSRNPRLKEEEKGVRLSPGKRQIGRRSPPATIAEERGITPATAIRRPLM
jgi:hypothetical protein